MLSPPVAPCNTYRAVVLAVCNKKQKRFWSVGKFSSPHNPDAGGAQEFDYYFIGEECNEEDNPCLNGGRCATTNGLQTCSCPEGYTGDTCELELIPRGCYNDDADSPAMDKYSFTSDTMNVQVLRETDGARFIRCSVWAELVQIMGEPISSVRLKGYP